MSRDFMPRQVKTILGVELRSRAWLRGDGWSSLTVRRSASGVEIRSPFNVVGVPISRVSALAFVRSCRLGSSTVRVPQKGSWALGLKGSGTRLMCRRSRRLYSPIHFSDYVLVRRLVDPRTLAGVLPRGNAAKLTAAQLADLRLFPRVATF